MAGWDRGRGCLKAEVLSVGPPETCRTLFSQIILLLWTLLLRNVLHDVLGGEFVSL